MAIDFFEVLRMEIRDFGEPVTVTTPDEAVLAPRMIFDDQIEETGLGGLRGNLGQPVFRCLPEDAAPIVEGSVLTTLDGTTYRVFAAPIYRAKQLTEIPVIEQ